MYHGSSDPRSAARSRETLAEFSPEATARMVLARIRKLLDAYVPGLPIERGRAPDALTAALNDPGLERERLFVLGWLHWLNDDPTAAEPLLAEALRLAKEQNAGEALAEAAYWSSRVRLLLGRGEALTEYERVLRSLSGSPRAAAWLVDLLGRAGRIDRAEQVWKSVRGNRRVAGCVEGPLLEARMLLRRDELTTAERLLSETAPASGVVWVEQILLRAWIAASQKQAEKARELLRQAREGPYPAAALREWTAKIEQRLGGEEKTEQSRVPSALHDFLRGQQARREGRTKEAIAAYRAALDSLLAQSFARYGLARLGQENIDVLLESRPGLFLAVRCRALGALERFRRRQANPAEYLDALQHAVVHGYHDEAAEHFRGVAVALQQRQPDPAAVRELAAGPCTDAAERNAFRAALELAVGRLPAADAQELLLDWMKRSDLTEELRAIVDRQQLRLALLTGESAHAPRADSPTMRLWQAAQRFDPQSAESERWCDEVRELRTHVRTRGLAQALLLQEAAQRGDAAAVLALLEEIDNWRGLPTPPNFLLRTLESIAAAHSHHPACRHGLARWLQVWEPSSLGQNGKTLMMLAGLTPMNAATAEAPPGVPAVPWLLHQAARAIGSDDALESLAYIRRALALDAELAGTNAPIVREALPELERRARAQRLAVAMQPEGEAAPIAAGVLIDAVDALAELPDGSIVLDALDTGDAAAIRAHLETLCETSGLSPRLTHHLALLMLRAARVLEERDDSASAEPYWRRAWQCWLRYLASSDHPMLLDFLLQQHRHRVNDLLARNAVDAARRHWDLVRDLPARAARIDQELGRHLAECVEQFREELATEYLLTTRESMRFGAVPEGWRADYEKGLTYLRRLLSLDRDNLRLLVALVEICNDWFLDLYHQNDTAMLRRQLDRFTPFAQQLARRIDERPSDLPARVALSDYWKFRGFLAADREQKAALYREALRFNPANANVRELLDGLTE
ncbi:MAG TPA: hypothetical protein VE999_01820 [Gemmataceae bacterium]|nr:hypothetical protein [Gemmataceae bacterium]